MNTTHSLSKKIFICLLPETFILWADNLRVFAVFAVILLHVAEGFVGGITPSDPMYGSYTWWAGNIYDSITRWCVPLFVMISGYFLLNTDDANKLFFRKRLHRILIPLLFWSVFFSFWLILKSYAKGDLETVHLTIIEGWISGAPFYHLWYLFMIPFLYLVTPILRVFHHSASRDELSFFILVSFSLAMISAFAEKVLIHFHLTNGFMLFSNKFLLYLGYYALGGYIGKYNPKTSNTKCLAILMISLLITIFGSYFFTYSYFYSYLSINTVFASIALFFLIKSSLDKDLRIGYFAAFSFGIYLIHPVFLDLITFFGKDQFLDKLDVYIYIPVVSFIVFILSYIGVFIMSKIKFLNKCI